MSWYFFIFQIKVVTRHHTDDGEGRQDQPIIFMSKGAGVGIGNHYKEHGQRHVVVVQWSKGPIGAPGGVHCGARCGGVHHGSLAWDELTESNDVVIAVIDTGVDYHHPDMAANLWENSDEDGSHWIEVWAED